MMTLRDDQPEPLLEEPLRALSKDLCKLVHYIDRTTLTCVVNTAFTYQGLWISLICLGVLVKQDGEKGHGQTETILSKIERARARANTGDDTEKNDYARGLSRTRSFAVG